MPPTFKKHLKNAHKINDQVEQKRLLPPFAGNPCFYPGCTSTTRFPATTAGRLAYNDHLHADHDVTDENERFEYSLDRIRGYVLPRRPDNGAAELEDDIEEGELLDLINDQPMPTATTSQRSGSFPTASTTSSSSLTSIALTATETEDIEQLHLALQQASHDTPGLVSTVSYPGRQ